MFDPVQESERSWVRAASQEALGLFFIGMDMNGDTIEERVTEALAYAGVSRGTHVSADLDLVREPVADTAHQLRRVEDPNLAGPTLHEIEALLYDEQVAPARLAETLKKGEWNVSETDIREIRSAARFERIPQSVITDARIRDTGEM